MMSSKRRGRGLMVSSRIAGGGFVVWMALSLGWTEQARLTPDSDGPVMVEALPLRLELAQSVSAQPSAPRLLPGGPELRDAVQEEEGAPDAVTPGTPASRSQNHHPYQSSRSYPVANDLARTSKDTPGSSRTLVKGPAVPHNEPATLLCPVSDSASQAGPACFAVDLFSSRGYPMLPGTHVRLGVASDHVNLMVRFATF